jgi:thiamine biosynthesis lipoprotein
MVKEYNYHTRIMGCDLDMTFVATSVHTADEYFTRSIDIASFFEKKFSRFDKNSELSRVNTIKKMHMSNDFISVFSVARDLYHKTQGKFNPLLQVRRIGYTDTFETIVERGREYEDDLRYDVCMNDIVLDGDVLTLQRNQQLDFGGFLKGYVAEKIAQSIEGDHGMIINIGGDIYVRGTDHRGKEFKITIIHPYDEGKNVSVTMKNCSICTSGTYKRKWKIAREESHHIVDPHTKRSTQTDIVSATVLHEHGATADAYATYAVTIGAKKSESFFRSQGVNYVIMCNDGMIKKSDIFKQII